MRVKATTTATTNKLLKGLFSLDHNIRLYIPTTIDINKKADTRAYVSEALSLFSSLFGGSTEFKALGAWQSKKGLVTEKVTIVESYATAEAIEKGLQEVLNLAIKLKKELRQEAISLEYDNKLYFI